MCVKIIQNIKFILTDYNKYLYKLLLKQCKSLQPIKKGQIDFFIKHTNNNIIFFLLLIKHFFLNSFYQNMNDF